MKEEKIKVKTTSICCGYGHKIKKKKNFNNNKKKELYSVVLVWIFTK